MTFSTDLFDKLANAILAAGGDASPSELHGLACGLLCAGAKPDAARWEREFSEVLDLDALPADLLSQLKTMADDAQKSLSDSDFGFQLLLAEEDDIGVRAQSLGQWCSGFLHGFGVGDSKVKLRAESEEALSDLGAIAQIDAESAGDVEQGEEQLLQVEEYVRVAVLTIYTEVSAPKDAAAGGRTVH